MTVTARLNLVKLQTHCQA